MIKTYTKGVGLIFVIVLFLAYFMLGQDNPVKNTQINKVGDEFVIVDSGGYNTKARIKANIIPFEKLSGIKVTIVNSTDYQLITDVVEKNENIFDVVNVDSCFGTNIGNKGYLESIDYNVVSKDDLRICEQYVVGAEVYANVIAYNTNFFNESTRPKDYKDFFDNNKIFGAKAIPRDPVGLLEAALLADGVSYESLYPLDVKRALNKLETIKDDIVWWKDGDEPIKLLNQNKVLLAIAWSGRLILAKEKGAPIDITFYQAIKKTAARVIPKDAPNLKNAMKFIKFISAKEAQAAYRREIPYGSTNKAIPDMLSPSQVEKIGFSSRFSNYQFFVDNEYWAFNYDKVNEIFNKWIKKHKFRKLDF